MERGGCQSVHKVLCNLARARKNQKHFGWDSVGPRTNRNRPWGCGHTSPIQNTKPLRTPKLLFFCYCFFFAPIWHAWDKHTHTHSLMCSHSTVSIKELHVSTTMLHATTVMVPRRTYVSSPGHATHPACLFFLENQQERQVERNATWLDADPGEKSADISVRPMFLKASKLQSPYLKPWHHERKSFPLEPATGCIGRACVFEHVGLQRVQLSSYRHPLESGPPGLKQKRRQILGNRLGQKTISSQNQCREAFHE